MLASPRRLGPTQRRLPRATAGDEPPRPRQTATSHPISRGARDARASRRKGDSDEPNAPCCLLWRRLRPRCDAVRASASGVGPPRVITIVSGCSPVPRERGTGPDLSPTTVFALYHTGQGRRGA